MLNQAGFPFVVVDCRGFAEDYGADFWSDDEDNEKMSRSWSSTSDDSFNCDVVAGNRRRPGHLYFEFFEVCSPYGRIPLMDKVPFYVLSACSLSWSWVVHLYWFLDCLHFARYMNYPRAFLG
jgi:hypothetical protein